MRKVIAAINMTIDGVCDHTAGIPDDELHQHYTDLLNASSVMLYGRITYQLMEYWREVLEHPTGKPSFDEFAVAIDKIPKIVFSRTLQHVDWKSSTLAQSSPSEELSRLRASGSGDILVGSPGLINLLTQLDLIDEYQLCVHPVIAGKGMLLFKAISEKKILELVSTKPFKSGAIVLYYRKSGNAVSNENA
jgi:dihydrofolate reductase